MTGWRLVVLRASGLLLLFIALVPIVDTLASESARHARIAAAVERGAWAMAFGPPLGVAAGLLAAPMLLGLVLLWRVPVREHAVRLALVVLLWTFGQASVLHPTAWDRILIDWWHAHLAPSWPRWARALYLWSFAKPFFSMLWPVSWVLAVAAFVGFARVFPQPLRRKAILGTGRPVPRSRLGRALHALGCAGQVRPLGRGEAALGWGMVAWLCLAPTTPRGWWAIPLLGAILGAGALWATTKRPQGRRASRATWLVRALAGATLLAALDFHDDAIGDLGMAIGLVTMVARSRALTATAAWGFWLVPLGWSALWVLSDDTDRLMRLSPWMVVALFEGLRYLRLGYLEAEPRLRARVLWVYVGFLAAGGLAFLWVMLARGGTLLGCTGPDDAIFCRAVAYQDWALLLPLPVLTAFLAVAVFYSGAVEPELVLRRTAALTAAGLAVIAVFGCLESVLHKVLEQSLPHGAPAALSAGVSALCLHPVKQGCERWITRALTLVLAIPAVRTVEHMGQEVGARSSETPARRELHQRHGR